MTEQLFYVSHCLGMGIRHQTASWSFHERGKKYKRRGSSVLDGISTGLGVGMGIRPGGWEVLREGLF